MKQIAVYASALLIVVTPVFILPSCNKSTSSDDDLIGNWLRSYDFDGDARSEAVSFTIGDKAYIATGQSDRDRYADMWEFDLDKKYWLNRADMPAAAWVMWPPDLMVPTNSRMYGSLIPWAISGHPKIHFPEQPDMMPSPLPLAPKHTYPADMMAITSRTCGNTRLAVIAGNKKPASVVPKEQHLLYL